MSKEPSTPQSSEPIEINLGHTGMAAFWAWLWPGAGHFYQGRYAKGTLFMVCILTTYFFGLAIGGGHVVYASWAENDRRWQYFCQLGVGLPAFPAIIQAKNSDQVGNDSVFGDLMAPPEQPVQPKTEDELARWHLKYHFFFELGTLYTMVAGLLNILAIYDAWGGPVIVTSHDDRLGRAPPKDSGKRPSVS